MDAASVQDDEDRSDLVSRYQAIRGATEILVASLSAEDCQVQSMPDASPIKWHLAHTSWFFETFLLQPHLAAYGAFDPTYAVLFNSYYVAVGDRHPRPQRGLLTRPTLDEVRAYRRHVDRGVVGLLQQKPSRFAALIELGLHHEQQHQELILMDIKHLLSCNPMDPVCCKRAPDVITPGGRDGWVTLPSGLYDVGHDGAGFSFDNEGPRHRVWLEPFDIAANLVEAGAYADFIADGGYRRPELWLSDGWAHVEADNWCCPLYWRQEGKGWTCFTLRGRRPITLGEPVLHLSYYEAEAFARWTGARLPTEAEWEVAVRTGNLKQCADTAWQWTASAYLPYRGYRTPSGAIGEYNGKFMINQMVLRGGSLATPLGHSRNTYRNFFPPASRWAFSGLRLARDA